MKKYIILIAMIFSLGVSASDYKRSLADFFKERNKLSKKEWAEFDDALTVAYDSEISGGESNSYPNDKILFGAKLFVDRIKKDVSSFNLGILEFLVEKNKSDPNYFSIESSPGEDLLYCAVLLNCPNTLKFLIEKCSPGLSPEDKECVAVVEKAKKKVQADAQTTFEKLQKQYE